MSKELPYFQFEPAEYLTKDISFCSLGAQGLFINICSYYWQRGCELTDKQVLRRFNYPEELTELIEENVIRIDENGGITINFLLEQFTLLMGNKKESSKKGIIGNLKRWHKDVYNDYLIGKVSLNEAIKIAKASGGDKIAIAKTSHIREEEKRKDNIKEIEVDESENETNQFQEKIKSDLKAIETKNQYSDKDFLENWNELRLKHLKKPSHLNRIGRAEDLEIFEDLKKDYAKEDFKNAMVGLFKQKVMPNGNTTMQSNPSHFLKFFNSYLTAFHDQNDSLYGKVKIESL